MGIFRSRRLPDVIRLRCFLGSAPFPGARVIVRLESTGRAPTFFHFRFGPADADGRLDVTRDEILADAEERVKTYRMAYRRIERRWTGRIELEVANIRDLRHMGGDRAAYKLLKEHEGERLTLEAEVVPERSATVDVIEEEAAGAVPDAFVQPIRDVVHELALGNYEALEADGRARRTTAAGLREAVETYGAHLVDVTDEAIELTDVYAWDDGTWAFEVPMSTEEEGWSDLTLRLSGRRDATGAHVEIEDLEVM